MFPYISLFCPTFTLWPRKSSIFPIFVIFVIYNPRFCPFVHFVIVQYCIYCPIYRPILYLCFLGGNHPRNIHQKYGYHCWWRTCLGPFLAKTSRTAVLTAIMDLSAGGRLYKYMLSSPTTNAIRQGYQGGPEWSQYSSFHQMISLIFPWTICPNSNWHLP